MFGIKSKGTKSEKKLNMSSEIIQVKQSAIHRDDIISQQFHTYTPYTTSFNNNDEIRITIQSQDLYVLPSDSYLFIEVSIAKQDGTEIADGDAAFASNFIAHLFSEVRYELNGIEIDRSKLPGITSFMKMLAACKEEDKNLYNLFTLNGGGRIRTGTFNMMLRFYLELDAFGFYLDFVMILTELF